MAISNQFQVATFVSILIFVGVSHHSAQALDVASVKQIRNKFYASMPPGANRNFQFAVFQFGDTFDPPINWRHINWSSRLVVEDPTMQNSWQAAAFLYCQPAHTEQAIIDGSFFQMLQHECDQEAPHSLSIYSYHAPCPDCKNRIQALLESIFERGEGIPHHATDRYRCVKEPWNISLYFSVPYRVPLEEEKSFWRDTFATIQDENHSVYRGHIRYTVDTWSVAERTPSG